MSKSEGGPRVTVWGLALVFGFADDLSAARFAPRDKRRGADSAVLIVGGFSDEREGAS